MVDDVKWDMVPLGLVAEFHTGWTPPSGDDRYYGGSHKWANISDVGTRHLYDTERTISDFALEKQPGARLALPGDLLFPFKLSIGAVSFACEEMYTNEAIAVFPPNEKFDLRFAYYAFPYFLLKNAGVNIYGAPLLNSTLIKQARVPSPPLETQHRIADYLDRETAEIDAAVADLDKYVELLEKRLESTGREILTELSNEHPLIQTKFLVDITTGSGDTQDAVENGDFPFYVRSDTVQRSGEYEFDCDAVLTSGDGAGVGKIFHLASGKFKAHQRVYVMHSFRRVSPTYFYWMFKSTFPDVIKYGGAKSTVDSVRMPMIANLKLPVPPPAIQAKVSGRFANLDQEVSALITESTRLRDLLLKRRSVLITEVVTGRKQV